MNFQPPDGYTTEELAEFDNVLPATPEKAYAEGRKDERDELLPMLSWAYGKLEHKKFQRLEDALELDRIKLLLEHGVLG